MAEETDFTKLQRLSDMKESDEPVFVPIKNRMKISDEVFKFIAQNDGMRDRKKTDILNYVEQQPYLSQMPIVANAESYIETTEKIDVFVAQQISMLVDVIEEMLAIVAEKYIPKKEYSRLKKMYEMKQEKTIDVASNKIDAMLKTVKDDIELRMEKGLNRNQLNGVRLYYFRQVQGNSNFTIDEQKQLMLDVSKLVSSYYNKLKKDGLETTEGTVSGEANSEV